MATLRECLVVVVAGLCAGGHAAAQGTPPDPTPLWHVKGTGSGTPVYQGDTAYFLSDDRQVSAVDVETGDVRWTTPTGVPGYDAFFGTGTAGTALALAESTVVAGDWDIVGFDRATGTRRWTYEAPAGDGPGLFLGPHHEGVVYTGSPGGRAYAIDAASGRLRWMTTVVEGHMTSVFRPVVDRDRVVVGYSTYVNPNVGGLAMLEAATGRLRWRSEFPRARVAVLRLSVGASAVLVDVAVTVVVETVLADLATVAGPAVSTPARRVDTFARTVGALASAVVVAASRAVEPRSSIDALPYASAIGA